jgi:biotin transporter BioY
MKVLVGFVIISFVIGLMAWRIPARWRAAALFVVCLLVTFAYFSLNQL